MKTNAWIPTLVLTTVASAGLPFHCSAALVLGDLNPHPVSFSDFAAPATWASASPGVGQLDSDDWAYGTATVGATTTSSFGGDLTGGLGASPGGETTGGVYAFAVGGGVTALGIQPNSTVWGGGASRGNFTLNLQNGTGNAIEGLIIDYDIYVLNDEDRANVFNFWYSDDNVNYTHVTDADFTSPEAQDASAAWVVSARSVALNGLNLPDGANIYIRWTGGDASGSGSRDEFALAGLNITPVPELPGTALYFGLGMLALCGGRVVLDSRAVRSRS